MTWTSWRTFLEIFWSQDLKKKNEMFWCCSSINYFRYGFYVLIGLVSGQEEPVLWHKDLLVVVVGGEWLFQQITNPYAIKPEIIDTAAEW